MSRRILASARFSFCAGHFTVFSATSRERVHGHSYVAHLVVRPGSEPAPFRKFEAPKQAHDSRLRQGVDAAQAVVDHWHDHMLLPGASPFVRVEQCGEIVEAAHAGTVLRFGSSSVRVTELANITGEALSAAIADAFVAGTQSAVHCGARLKGWTLDVGVSSGDGQAVVVSRPLDEDVERVNGAVQAE